MLRCTGLPFLPGNTFRDIYQTKFHKPHHFDVNKGICVLAETKRGGIGGQPLATDPEPFNQPSLYPPKCGPLAPSWIANDKKVLCFYGYFKEILHEIARVPYQIRKVKILYYLEDGTMQVSEPRTLNSGIPQGCLVTRQRIPKASPERGFVSILDINVGQPIKLFDRFYTITGCDKFTRKFLNRCGISVSDNSEAPDDPTAVIRRSELLASLPKQPSITFDNLAKFLENDRKVLRFSGYWDDRGSEFGDVHHLEILYHLSDDTMEIKEKLAPNSGYSSNGMFLRRGKLPKDLFELPKPGEHAPFTVLNVLGKGLRGGRYVLDCLEVGAEKTRYYKDSDLSIGATVNVYGRQVILTDCDGFTQNFYRQKYGIEEFTAKYNPAIHRASRRTAERELPPFNGWGSHEDSEGNCKTVEPKPPHRDFHKFFKYDGYILRFGARMVSRIQENNQRFFIVLYYLEDDTMSVYEMAIRNSGFLGGEFFKRAKFYLPSQNFLTAERPKTYQASDFYLGAKVNLRDHIFVILSADAFTLNFMERNFNEFIYSNVCMIMHKVRDHLRPIYKDFIAKYLHKVITEQIEGKNTSFICYEDLREMLVDLLGDKIVEQEIVTLCRHFSAETEVQLPFGKDVVLSAAHAELRRALWDEKKRVYEHIYDVEPGNEGYLTQPRMISVIRACKIPFDIALIEKIFTVVNKNHKGDIEIMDFMHFLDPVENPSCPIPPLNIKADIKSFKPYTVAGKMIDWDALLMEINLEEDLKKLNE